MNQTLENNLFDYVNFPTVKCPIVAKRNPEPVVPLPMLETQERVATSQISIQEPHYPIFAWESFLAFLAVFAPLFLGVVTNADKIIYMFVTIMGKLIKVQ